MYKKFEELKKRFNVTSYEVAKQTGIAEQTLSDWKRNLYTPKIDKLVLIARYFNVPVEYFLE